MARSRRSKVRSKSPSTAKRVKTVWLSLMGAMTVVGGLLIALNPSPAASAGGRSLPAMMATGVGSSMASILAGTKHKAADGSILDGVDRSKWQAIVIHHSGSPVGNQETIAQQHAAYNVKPVGFHFIVGNGRKMGDGEIHATNRWNNQLRGAVVGQTQKLDPRRVISICLIGDGEREKFTQAQLSRTVELVGFLCEELNIPAERVFLHSQLANTADPGRLFPEMQFRDALTLR
jgi:hypothetical protein